MSAKRSFAASSASVEGVQKIRPSSVAECYCGATMCRGELQEAKDQPQTKVNSIRPGRLASRRRGGMRPRGWVPCEACGYGHTPSSDIARSMLTGGDVRVSGVRMARRLHGLNQDPCGEQEPAAGGRALTVAMKRLITVEREGVGRSTPQTNRPGHQHRPKCLQRLHEAGAAGSRSGGLSGSRTTPPWSGPSGCWRPSEGGNDARQWHTLIDKVFSPKTLALAFASVTKRDRAAGVDGITTQPGFRC